MASPGMMQSGLSRQLFEAWCTDKRNGLIVAGYCVEGTLAKVSPVHWDPRHGGTCTCTITACADRAFRSGHQHGTEAAPQDVSRSVWSACGHGIEVYFSADYISFAAHTDYQGTSNFIKEVKPPHIVGVM